MTDLALRAIRRSRWARSPAPPQLCIGRLGVSRSENAEQPARGPDGGGMAL